MKKTFVVALALAAAVGASAQQSLVKDVDRYLKGASANPEKALADIQPALTNPESAEMAETWVVAGRAGFDFFTTVSMLMSTGQEQSPATQANAASALLDGFNYYLHALPLDTVTDAKGKIKTKFSKDIVKGINQKYDNLRNAGVMAWGNQDFGKAYDIWEMYLSLPTNPVLGKNAPKAAPDTIQGELMWNQAVAKLLQQDNAMALKKFRQMENYGYFPDDYYAYAMTAAQALDDEEAANEFARKGLATASGASNSGFLAQLINSELAKKNYSAADKLVNDALAVTPESNVMLRAQLFDIMGTVKESEENMEAATGFFKKATETDPTYANSFFNYARMLYNAAITDDESVTEDEFNTKIAPKLKESANYFERAYELNENLSQIPGILYRLYYRLGAGYEDKADYWKNL